MKDGNRSIEGDAMKNSEQIEVGATYTLNGRSVKVKEIVGDKVWYYIAGWPTPAYVSVSDFRMAAQK